MVWEDSQQGPSCALTLHRRPLGREPSDLGQEESYPVFVEDRTRHDLALDTVDLEGLEPARRDANQQAREPVASDDTCGPLLFEASAGVFEPHDSADAIHEVLERSHRRAEHSAVEAVKRLRVQETDLGLARTQRLRGFGLRLGFADETHHPLERGPLRFREGSGRELPDPIERMRGARLGRVLREAVKGLHDLNQAGGPDAINEQELRSREACDGTDRGKPVGAEGLADRELVDGLRAVNESRVERRIGGVRRTAGWIPPPLSSTWSAKTSFAVLVPME